MKKKNIEREKEIRLRKVWDIFVREKYRLKRERKVIKMKFEKEKSSEKY